MKNNEAVKGIYRITDIETMQIVCLGVSEKNQCFHTETGA